MKKYLIALAAIAVVFGCSKEDPIQENTIQDNPVQEEPVNEEPEGTVVSFTATFPELTKATVDDTAFAWEVGDQIALPANNIEGGYAIFTNSAAYPSTFTYTLKPGESLKAGKALYPATTPGTEFASISAAKKAFQMEADYALGQSSLTFTHKSALINLNFSNVPSFATAIVVNDGASDVATINLSGISDGASVLADVPITPDGEKTYTFKLMENNNVLISKSKTATLAAGNYYHTPEIAIGPFILLTGSAATSVSRIKLTQRNGYNSFGENNYSWTPTTLANGSKYVILPIATSSFWPWLEAGIDAVRVDIYSSVSDSDWLGYSDYVYIRDLTFSDKVDNKLKTKFRVYPISGSDTNVTISATVSKTKVWVQYWSEANYIHYWDFVSIGGTTWANCPAMDWQSIQGNYFKSFVFDAKVVGETGTCMFKDAPGDTNNKTGNFSLDFSTYSEIYITGTNQGDLTLNTTKSVASSSLGSGSVAVGSGYYEFALDDAFKENVVVKITNSTSTLRADRYTIEHDYYYEL